MSESVQRDDHRSSFHDMFQFRYDEHRSALQVEGLMICDKYREQTALCFRLLRCCVFSQRSDCNHFTTMTERGSSYEEKYLTED
jgi:hypothetical protein